jgi:hypothetical protein
MKIQKWTLGLAALGLVTLSPALLAQDAIAQQLVPVQTALSATTISGYVDTSAVWNPGTGNANPAPYAFNHGKQDGFNLDAADLKISKALDEGQWSAGYTFELSYGPDAQDIDAGAYPIRQAYVTMRTPIGNGIDWQLGRWDNILGYESSDSYKNPNYTRSYGYTFEPTEHTGLLASYKFCDAVSLQLGVADTVATGSVNTRTDGYYGKYYESKKSLVSAVTLTAPESWGSFAGSKLYAGFDLGQGGSSEGFRTSGTATDTTFSVKPHNRVRTEWYVGTTINTPVKGLTFGASWDGIEHNDVNWDGDAYDTGYFQSFAGYASYKATDKLTISGRVEYASGSALGLAADENNNYYYEDYNPLNKVLAVTGTIQYDLWANVISRLEIRWDHAANGANAFGGSSYSYYDESYYNRPDKKNEVMVAANVIYKF